MKILISGVSGLVGTELKTRLIKDGHEVAGLTRNKSSADDVQWAPDEAKIEDEKLAGLDAVVHLAGENIAGGRWTAERKKRIRDSRVGGTRLLCEALARQDSPPKVFVCASGVGYYGDRGDEVMTEESAAGTGFLAEVCQEWEGATAPAEAKNIRIVKARIGVVLTPKGGALAKMLTPFRMGVGGKIGSGRQFMSWISLDDVAGVLAFSLTNESLSGPVNAVGPNPVTNAEFTKALGKALGRWTIFPMPGFAAKLMFGEMAEELLLAGTRAEPKRLQEAGFTFQHPNLDQTLAHLLDMQ